MTDVVGRLLGNFLMADRCSEGDVVDLLMAGIVEKLLESLLKVGVVGMSLETC